VYSWIECTFANWHSGLRAWLDLRKSLYAEYQIPPSAELHATKFIAGRGNPSQNPGVNMSKRARQDVAEMALTVIGTCPELQVGTVYRQTLARRKSYAVERDAVYAELVDHLDTRLSLAREHGMVVMDGNGTATGYYGAHRGLKLSSRSLVEDPMFVPAHRSAWVQMADLVAWTAYQGLQRHPGKGFAWRWYDQYLRCCDVNTDPLAV
ncbi:MAG: DUF3800 domain-containing protein, partial [Actinomycetota bacterium]|nr:DUF3800 domain-containing protein [Actinomycetota bacterium]